MATPAQPSWRGNLALLLAAVVASLVLVEITLQTAALVVRLTVHRAASSWQGTGQLKLLALGDSNTFGFAVAEQEAYPKVLEALWNAVPEHPRLEVINLGFPGTNSSQLRNRLPKLLAMLRPDVVTVMVGINDTWTAPEPVADETTWRERLDFFAWRYSRLYRLLWMLRRAFLAETIDVPRTASRSEDPLVVQLGDERVAWHLAVKEAGQPPVARAPAVENLTNLAQRAAQAGVELIFLTYPADAPFSSAYGGANVRIRRAATLAGARLIDLGPPISGSCSGDTCETLQWDHHPTVLGHQRAAALIVAGLEQWLATRH